MERTTMKLTRVLVITLLFVGAATTASSQDKRSQHEALAARGAVLAGEDPQATELRNQQPEGPVRRGFDIGMGAAEGQTSPGPGKDGIRDSLSPDGQEGFTIAVNFSLARNRKKLTDLAPRGEEIANEDPLALELRRLQPDDSARLGFDIGMAAAEGQTLPGSGKQKIHDSLYLAEQAGFAMAVDFSLERNRNAGLASKGAAIAKVDPLVALYRTVTPRLRRTRDVFYQLGFDIGLAAAEGQTLPGSGKQKIHDSLSPLAQSGFATAVTFSLERNRNAELAKTGAEIAQADSVVAAARAADLSILYWLGFDIATGIFGDPAKGARGNTQTGPGSLGIRDSLSAAGQRGFDASVKLHLSRNYRGASGAVVRPAEDLSARGGALEASRDRVSDVDAGRSRRRQPQSPVVTRDEQFGTEGAAGRVEAAFQPENTIRVKVRYKKEFGYLGDTNAFGYVGPTSCGAFSVSVMFSDGSRPENPIRISSDSKMAEAGGYYVCSYLVSDIPLNQPTIVSVGLSGLDRSAEWKGGSYAQPPRGQQRTIIIVSGRVPGSSVTLTQTQPRARQTFEMIYAPAPPG